MSAPLFPLGQIVATPGAIDAADGYACRPGSIHHAMAMRSAGSSWRTAVSPVSPTPERAAEHCASARHVDHGERFNAFTHLGGALLALPAAIVLIVLAARDGGAWRVVSVSVYGLTLVLLYSFSTLYHSVRGRHKIVLRKLDHQSIYLLIAGSYTPFCLVTLHGPWGWSLFGVVWGLAVIGGVQELWPIGRKRILSVAIYLLMGWVALVALVPLHRALGTVGFAWIATGGVLYTSGIAFYTLDSRLSWAHGVWHLFVVAGSAIHYIAILRYVL